MPPVPIMRIPLQPVALQGPMRQHPILRGSPHLRGGFRPVRILERSSRLRRQDRIETTRPRFSRKQHEILLGRLEQHLPRLLRQPDTDRTGVVLHRIRHIGRRRAQLFRPRGHEWSDSGPSDVSVSMLVGKHERNGRAGRSNSWTYILRTYARRTLGGAATAAKDHHRRRTIRSSVTYIDCFRLVLSKCCERGSHSIVLSLALSVYVRCFFLLLYKKWLFNERCFSL